MRAEDARDNDAGDDRDGDPGEFGVPMAPSRQHEPALEHDERVPQRQGKAMQHENDRQWPRDEKAA